MDMEIEQTIRKLPYWNQLTNDEKELLRKNVTIQSFTKNELISSYDTSCLGMIILLKGQVRVYVVSEDGREITLFKLRQDDYCVTTAACVIHQLTFDTVISAEMDTEMLIVPTSLFNRLVEENIYANRPFFTSIGLTGATRRAPPSFGNLLIVSLPNVAYPLRCLMSSETALHTEAGRRAG